MSMATELTTKAVFLDFMGTCLDWHSSVTRVLPANLSQEQRSRFALTWRVEYFKLNAARHSQGLPPEDVDTTFRKALAETLIQYPDYATAFGAIDHDDLINAWHHQTAWPDVASAIAALKQKGYEVFVHANGTTRLQLDLVRHSGLSFNMLFSSELLGVYKPAPDAYQKALDLIRRKPNEVVLVAAHAYDLRGAKDVGMKTVYIDRWTDDIDVDKDQAKLEFDRSLDDMTNLANAIAEL